MVVLTSVLGRCTLVVEDYRWYSGKACHRLHLHTAVQGQIQSLLYALFLSCMGISIATTSFRYCWRRNPRCTQQTPAPYIASIYIYSCRDIICSASGNQWCSGFILEETFEIERRLIPVNKWLCIPICMSSVGQRMHGKTSQGGWNLTKQPTALVSLDTKGNYSHPQLQLYTEGL